MLELEMIESRTEWGKKKKNTCSNILMPMKLYKVILDDMFEEVIEEHLQELIITYSHSE